jgi:hypothetical protein
MFYKRPSLRRGGMPTGIDSLTPRTQARGGGNIGGGMITGSNLGSRTGFSVLDIIGGGMQEELTGGAEKIKKSQLPIKSGKGLKSGNLFQRFLTQVRPGFSLPSVSGVASVAAPFIPSGALAYFNRPKTVEALKYMKEMSRAGIMDETTAPEDLEAYYKELDRLNKVGEEISFKDAFFLDPETKTYPKFLGRTEDRDKRAEADKTKIDMDEIANNVIRDNKSKKDFQQKVLEGEKKFLEESEKDPKINIKDNLEGETVEDSFDSEYDKQMRRLEKYLGSTNRETKGRLALALSDAIGTEGTIADKASALNKSLLGIMGQRRKDKKELAKIAFAATTELEKAKITAGKKGFSERRFDEYANLASKKDRTKSEESRFQILKDALGIKTGLTGPSATAAGKIASEVNKSIIELQTAAENEKTNIQSEIISGINQLLLIQGVTRDNVSGIIGFDVSNYLKADGGRVNKAMGGGASETPAEPVATNLSFEQLRTRLPKEITDDIVRLVATSEEALQDFAYIRTQGDVEKFNVKYGVNLVLPQNTA